MARNAQEMKKEGHIAYGVLRYNIEHATTILSEVMKLQYEGETLDRYDCRVCRDGGLGLPHIRDAACDGRNCGRLSLSESHRDIYSNILIL